MGGIPPWAKNVSPTMSRPICAEDSTTLVASASLIRSHEKAATVRILSVLRGLVQRRLVTYTAGSCRLCGLTGGGQILDAVSLGLLASTELYLRNGLENGIIRSSSVLHARPGSLF
jgi:hypothetical protein